MVNRQKLVNIETRNNVISGNRVAATTTDLNCSVTLQFYIYIQTDCKCYECCTTACITIPGYLASKMAEIPPINNLQIRHILELNRGVLWFEAATTRTNPAIAPPIAGTMVRFIKSHPPNHHSRGNKYKKVLFYSLFLAKVISWS
jgi:hypothetical protein